MRCACKVVKKRLQKNEAIATHRLHDRVISQHHVAVFGYPGQTVKLCLLRLTAGVLPDI
jgi:hypothetical protein